MLHDYLLKKDLKANTEGLIRITRKHEGNPEQWVRSIIVGKHGYYISHPDTTRILRNNFFREMTQHGDTTAIRMVSNMVSRGDRYLGVTAGVTQVPGRPRAPTGHPYGR